MNIEVVKYLVSEVKRQHASVEDVFGMAMAWEYARETSRRMHPFDEEIQKIAMYVGSQSGINGVHYRGDNYRWTPITVGGIYTGADPANIPRQMQLLCSPASNHPVYSDDGTINKDEVDSFVKSLLDIHPWVDGNGRTASIVYNWLMGTLDNPVPLPYYYGDK